VQVVFAYGCDAPLLKQDEQFGLIYKDEISALARIQEFLVVPTSPEFVPIH